MKSLLGFLALAATTTVAGVDEWADAGVEWWEGGAFCRDSSKLTRTHYEQLGQRRELKSLTLYGRSRLTDELLALLAGLEQLEKVAIDGVNISDAGLRHLAGWKNLRQLTFFHVQNKDHFTGAGLTNLTGLTRLESFGCGGSPFTDAGLAACAQLRPLTDLRIWHTLATDAGVAALTNLPALRSLRLAPQFRPRITDAALAHLAKITALATLSLGEMPLTWADGLTHLKSLPALKKLTLDLVDISDADLARLKAELPAVQVDWKAPDEKQREQMRRNWRKSPPSTDHRIGSPNGDRTRVPRLRIWCPGPLDDGAGAP